MNFIQTKIELTRKNVLDSNSNCLHQIKFYSNSVNVEEIQRSSQNVCSLSHPPSDEWKQVISI